MKRLKLGAALLGIAMSANMAFAVPSAPAGKKWVEVPELTDNFNSFDSSKWQKGHPYWNGRSPSQYNNNNISFGDGKMRLHMTVKDSNKKGNWVWAACVTSKKKSFTEGMYSEVRIKVADLSVTSSFWMQGNYSEIDVIENYGRVQNERWRHLDYSMESNTHYFKHGWENDQTTHKTTKNVGQERNSSRFFTYGVWWKDKRTMVFYLDGKPVQTVKTPGDFSEPMYMFFDMETFTWGPGLPTLADLRDNRRNTAYYDFVKTYKLVNGQGNPGDDNSGNNNPGNGVPGGGDQCDTTAQCKTLFGNQATDCKDSHSANSICMCGSSACAVPSNPTEPKPVVTPVPTQAPVSGGVFQFKKANASGFAIDGNWGGANGQNVYIWSSDSSNVNQHWKEINRGNGYYSFQKANTNYCLDGGSGGAPGQNVYLWSCSSGNQNQHWKKVSLGGNKYRLEKRNAPSYSIDGGNGGSNKQNIYLWNSSNSNGNQQWILESK